MFSYLVSYLLACLVTWLLGNFFAWILCCLFTRLPGNLIALLLGWILDYLVAFYLVAWLSG